MKIIAMYLPQFHRVPENDMWWGDGFTEWTTVKTAEKLFPLHEQPKRPFNNNYYDLLDKKTVEWQASLMNRYGIDGMCFYHYYFKDGRKILEKPAENVLQWQDINMPFCFSWANESWVRSWSKLSETEGNPWSAKFDNDRVNELDGNGILLEQDYGSEIEWEKHYRYLSPFFHDKRYLKHEEMPIFMIYKPANIPCLKEMLTCWDRLAQRDGYPGIYTIGTNVNDKLQYGLKGINLQEPQDTIARFFPEKYNNDDHVMKSLEYQEVWNNLLNKAVPNNVSLGGFAGYDDTPRRGHGGCVIRDANPYIFYEGIKNLLKKADKIDAPFIFINAWNEWGEGMYLEPDEKYGLSFLEALCQAKTDALRMADLNDNLSGSTDCSGLFLENKSLQSTIERYRGYWRVFDKWMSWIEEGKSVTNYLIENKYKSIAIYGYGMLGKHLVYQMQQAGLNPVYVVDQQEEKKTTGITLLTIEDNLPNVDIMIVTVLYDYENIKKMLCKKINGQILPIDMLFSE